MMNCVFKSLPNWLVFLLPVFVLGCQPVAVQLPYERSKLISGIELDWSSHKRLAKGSDNWPLTWADDGHPYTSWGDGGGFGGTNSKGRVSLGIARIEDDGSQYVGINVWGGINPENPAQFKGKSYGIISIDGKFYLWVSPGSNIRGYEESRLYTSADHGATWYTPDWAFNRDDAIVNPTFLQFGSDYSGARDEYVYMYANHVKDSSTLDVQIPGEITLMRAPKRSLLKREAYQFYVDLDGNQNPVWSSDFDDRQAVFNDENGVGWNSSVSYNPVLERYFLITEHTKSFQANIGIFDAPEPWGPWTTVYYGKFASSRDISLDTFFYNFSNKWLGNKGLNFTLVFSGIKKNDSWNSVKGKFNLNN